MKCPELSACLKATNVNAKERQKGGGGVFMSLVCRRCERLHSSILDLKTNKHEKLQKLQKISTIRGNIKQAEVQNKRKHDELKRVMWPGANVFHVPRTYTM